MNLPENDYQILRLTNAFYSAYPNPPYIEILKKNQRAYNCLLLFNETIINLERIKQEALKFVEEYVLHITGIKIMHSREFNRRYAFSPLRYFHNILKNPIK